MLIHDLFERDVTRAIPPVVYFHEQQPEELEREVSEYIVTGGYKKDDTRATDDGIHEELLRLLTGMRAELAAGRAGTASLPAGSPASMAPVSRASRSCWASRSTVASCRAGARSPRPCSRETPHPRATTCAAPGPSWSGR
jgi:hypothetical protein